MGKYKKIVTPYNYIGKCGRILSIWKSTSHTLSHIDLRGRFMTYPHPQAKRPRENDYSSSSESEKSNWSLERGERDGL